MDQETFDNVQRIRSNVRRYPDGWREAHPLTGLMYCADCGAKMYVHRVNNGKRVPQYTCSAYSKIPVGTLCPTQHRSVYRIWKNCSAGFMKITFLASCRMNVMQFWTGSILKSRKNCQQRLQRWKQNYPVMRKKSCGLKNRISKILLKMHIRDKYKSEFTST